MILPILQTIGIIALVILLFNIMIFVHELGHFLAGKWRGAYIDRFQIWFGRPIWSVKCWGVKWGLGWIPAGGFVSLPQMGDMEAVEGTAEGMPKDLKPLSALDKVIIAAAGPIFSLLLAYVFAVMVWFVGKPMVDGGSSTIGYVLPGSPAEQAGLLPNDRIIAIDGHPVSTWVGDMQGVSELIALGEHDTVKMNIERQAADGSVQQLVIHCGYQQEDRGMWQRSSMRKVGILPAQEAIIGAPTPHSPAAKAGLKEGQRVVAVNGKPVYTPLAVMLAAESAGPLHLTLLNPDATTQETTLTPEVPANWQGMDGARPIMGFYWMTDERLVLEHPSPQQQVNQSLKLMYDTVIKIAAPDSSVGVQHLSGPVGIGTHIYRMLTLPDGTGWRWVLWFAVVLNVNLAVLNMLPLPVVDGGHVTLGLVEMLRGKPLPDALLGYVQSAFFIVLLSFFIFVTVLDVGDAATGSSKTPKLPDPVFKP